MIRLQNYINGNYFPPRINSYIPNFEPGTGHMYAEIPDSTAEDVDLAVIAAQRAFPIWSSYSAENRHDILMRVAWYVQEKAEILAQAESRDSGKPISLARKIDIPRAVSNLKFFATAAMHFSSESHEMPGQAINYTVRRPLGVVGCISPWNLPLYLLTWKIAPALAVGNTVVAKPSEVTPYTAHLLAEICMDAGLPEGVLNIVHGQGKGAGAALVRHPDVKAISFTGGTETGREIARIAAPQFKKLSLELGGKNPNIIFADCDYDEMLRTSLKSSFANQGQICLCGSRIFVESSIYEKFKNDFIAKADALRIGPPSDENTQVGSLVSEPHLKKVLSYVDIAMSEGGRVLLGGDRYKVEGEHQDGYYMKPTIIEDLHFECRTNQEEIFGPVVTITPFENIDDVITQANSVRYGLSATIWTRDQEKAMRMANEIEAGIVWINCWLLRDLRTPFGGMKDSGVGREGGLEALRFFTEPKNVCMKY